MAYFGKVLRNLKQERDRAQREVERLDQAISTLEGLSSSDHIGRRRGPGRPGRAGRPRRKLSAAARARIAAAQRARWAKLKAKKRKT